MTIGDQFPVLGQQPYWVFLSILAKMQQQNVFATVVGPMSQSAFTAKYGDPNNGVNPGGGFSNKLTAQAAANKYNANPGQAGGVNAPNPLTPNSLLGSNPLTGVNAIGDFFTRLSDPHTWVRVGEFVAGGLLLFIGGSAVLRGTPASQATKSVVSGGKKAVKVGKMVAK
jgi:hypothetical protein